MDQIKSSQNANAPDSESSKMKTEIWQKKRERINEKRLSKWHASRLRILQDKDDFASFIQYIKWKGGSVPEKR